VLLVEADNPGSVKERECCSCQVFIPTVRHTGWPASPRLAMSQPVVLPTRCTLLHATTTEAVNEPLSVTSRECLSCAAKFGFPAQLMS